MVALAHLWPRLRWIVARASSPIAWNYENPRRCVAALEADFFVEGDAYWRCHYDFGVRTRECDLLGGSKARELVVNALLPCAAAMAMVAGDSSGLSAVIRLLSSYPRCSTNAVTGHMRRQLSLGERLDGGVIQQGLLHIFQQYCRRGLCGSCPLNEEIWRVNSHHDDAGDACSAQFAG